METFNHSLQKLNNLNNAYNVIRYNAIYWSFFEQVSQDWMTRTHADAGILF